MNQRDVASTNLICFVIAVLVCLMFCTGCAAYKPPQDIVKATYLIRSACEDISEHNIELSRERLGGLMAELDKEQSKDDMDTNLVRLLKIKIAEEQENVEALKELPLAMQDLEAWAKGD